MKTVPYDSLRDLYPPDTCDTFDLAIGFSLLYIGQASLSRSAVTSGFHCAKLAQKY